MSCNMTESRTTAFLRNHPKLLAALFGMTILLSQTGAALAANGQTVTG